MKTPLFALEQIGLRRLTHTQYLEEMEKLGKPASRFMRLIDAGVHPGAMDKAYDLQHASPELSKLVSCISYFNYYLEFLSWISRNLENPRFFVELGCGNGLLTLALHQMWGGATCRGIDKNKAAIRVARQWIDANQSNNEIDFIEADLSEVISTDLVGRTGFPDVVVSCFFFHEIMHDDAAMRAAAANISFMLSSGKKLISLERFPDTEGDRAILASYLGEMRIHPIQQEVLFVGEERFPLTVFSTQAGGG